MRPKSMYRLVAPLVSILLISGTPGQAADVRQVEWSARLGQVSPADALVGSGPSFGLGLEWGDSRGGFLATLDLASLDSGAYQRGAFIQKTLGLAYTSRPLAKQGPAKSRQFWWGGGLAFIDELDQVPGYTLFVGYDLRPGLALEARHSHASRWGFDYGGTNISLGWRLPTQ